jgi:hypothetical protein
VGLRRGINDGFLFSVETLCYVSLVLLVASNQVWGRSMRTWAQISSFRPLIKHSLKKASDMPSILKYKYSKEIIKYSTILDYFN